MEKIVIFGANGFLGRQLAAYFAAQGWQVIADRVDITNLAAVRAHLANHQPQAVLNAAGKTGTPNVDWCEDHRAEVSAVNIAGALNIALACDELNLYLAHVGSGCIYQGDNAGRGFTEADEPNFFGSFYSRTKLYSEKILAEFDPLQLRIRIPICAFPDPKNVIDKLLNYSKIISVENSFTIVEDFLPAAFELIRRRERGIFNMTNTGSMDHEFLMGQYSQIVEPGRQFEVMNLDELAKVTKAPRSNCVLDTAKRENLGISMPEIKSRIPAIMQAYKTAAGK